MKRFFRRLAGYVVTAYANRLYRKAAGIAEKRHREEKTMVYVMSSYTNPSHLLTCNRKEFRAMKERLHLYHHHIVSLKKGCWYHTADAIERNGIEPVDMEARRLAFIRMALKRAGLR